MHRIMRQRLKAREHRKDVDFSSSEVFDTLSILHTYVTGVVSSASGAQIVGRLGDCLR